MTIVQSVTVVDVLVCLSAGAVWSRTVLRSYTVGLQTNVNVTRCISSPCGIPAFTRSAFCSLAPACSCCFLSAAAAADDGESYCEGVMIRLRLKDRDGTQAKSLAKKLWAAGAPNLQLLSGASRASHMQIFGRIWRRDFEGARGGEKSLSPHIPLDLCKCLHFACSHGGL